MTKQKARRLLVAVLMLCVAAAVAACGSSSSSSNGGSSSSTGASSSATSASTSSSAGGSGAAAQAAAAITKDTGIPQFTAPGPAITASKVKGKSIALIIHDLNADELVSIAKGVQQAAGVAGLKLTQFNGNGVVSAWQQGISQAISQHVGAIVLDGIATSLVRSSIQAADKAKIPVIAVEDSSPSTGPGQGAGAGIYGNVEPPDYTFGELIADDAIAQSHGHVQAGILTFDNPIAAAAVSGMKAALAKCSGCKVVAVKDIEPTSWSTGISPQTESLVRSQPNMNYVLTAADTMGIFATAGIRQAAAAAKVKVLGVDGSSPATLSLTKQGSIMEADPGSSPIWIGWGAVDQAMRGMLGTKPASPGIPYRYLSPQQLASANPNDLSSVYGTAYVAGYKKLWGIGG